MPATSAIDGGTVLVTGASSGIGMEIARIVATRAKKVVLVARRAERLAKLREELLAARPALEVDVVACDLAQRAEVTRLVDDLAARGVEVDVLVNNAGVGLMGIADRAPIDKTLQMIDLNVAALTQLTLALLPKMVARGRGGILNVSSGFGLAFLPTFAAYCGTKHFVTGFTEGLRADLAGTGVTVTQVCPGPVETEFQDHIGETELRPPAIVSISGERCARAAVRGFDRNRAMVIPGFVVSVALAINGASPRALRRLFARIVARFARRRELAKQPSVL